MPRPSTLLVVVLSVVVLAQAWALHGRGAPAASAPDAPSAHASRLPDAVRADAPADPDPLAMAVMARLERIDARLAALEAGRSAPQPAAALSPSRDRIDPRTIADADRRLARLLPDRDIDRDAWTRWQTTLASLPDEERFALSAAFARAVNEDRIRLRL